MTSQQDEITLEAVNYAIDVLRNSKAIDKKMYRKDWLIIFERLVTTKRKELGGIDTIEIRHSDKPDIVQRSYEVEL
jgi:hypothetical protein